MPGVYLSLTQLSWCHRGCHSRSSFLQLERPEPVQRVQRHCDLEIPCFAAAAAIERRVSRMVCREIFSIVEELYLFLCC